MIIKILGTGCAKCKALYEESSKAVQELKIDAEVVKIENMKDIVSYGVMRTPALVVDEEVKAVGKVLSAEEIKKIIQGGK
jgi:small redox-active disulfide protein 2